jgi:hypothetical protein
MHLQISGSPDDTASNVSAIVVALAGAGVNILGIGPDFNPPHVRVAVEQEDPYDPNDAKDPFNQALKAMFEAGLAPSIKPAVTVTMPNKAGALKAVLSRITRAGYTTESILVLASCSDAGTEVQFGVGQAILDGWDVMSDKLAELIDGDLASL